MFRLLALTMLFGCHQADGPLEDVEGLQHAQHNAALLGGAAFSTTELSAAEKRAFGILVTVRNELVCTATALSPTHILTARHCLAPSTGLNAFALQNLLADLSFRADGVDWPVTGALLHPSKDIAVLVLGAPLLSDDDIAFLAVPPTTFGPLSALNGTSVLAVGGGLHTPVEWGLAAAWFDVIGVDDERLVITPVVDGTGLCGGDSGAPLLNAALDHIVGIHHQGSTNCSAPSYVEPLWLEEAFLDLGLAQQGERSPTCSDEDAVGCDDTVRTLCASGFLRRADCALQNQQCLDGECRDIPCGDVSASGECHGDVARACLLGTLVEEDCAKRTQTCGFDDDLGRRACIPCTICDEICVELSADEAHCGGCNQPCAGVCIGGACRMRRVPDAGIRPSDDAGTFSQAPACICAATSQKRWSGCGLWAAGFMVFWRRRGL